MIPFNLCPFQSSLRPPLHKLHFICVSLRVPWERCIDNFLQKYDSSLFYRGKSNSAASNWIGLFSGVENDREREGTWPQTFYMGLLLNRDLIELQGTIDDNHNMISLFCTTAHIHLPYPSTQGTGVAWGKQGWSRRKVKTVRPWDEVISEHIERTEQYSSVILVQRYCHILGHTMTVSS